MSSASVFKRRTLVRSIAALFVGGGMLTTLTTPSAYAASGNWIVDAGGNWSTATSWSSNPTVPGTALGDVIGLTSNITAARTVTINTTSRTAGILNIGDSNNTNAFTLASSGGGMLMMNNGASNAQINETGSLADIISAPIQLNSNLAVSAAGQISFTGGITESGGTRNLIKSGAGALVLNGVSSYTGTTEVAAGTLRFVSQTSLYNNTEASWTAANINVKSGGTLAFNVGGAGQFTNANITTLLANLAVSTSATNGMNAGSNFAFNTDTTPNFFTLPDLIADSTGTSGGARGLTKLGVGELVLTNANTYTGATTVNGGTLTLANTAAVQNSASVALANATTLQIATDTAFTTLPSLTGSSGTGGTTIVAGRATAGVGLNHVLGSASLGANTFNFIGGTNVTSGTAAITFTNLTMSSGAAGTLTLNPTTATLTITSGVTGTGAAVARTLNLSGTSTGHSIGGAISNGTSNPTSLTKNNTSTWTLSGANTYTGTTDVNGGLLILDYSSQDNSKLADSAALTLGGGTLQLSGGTHTEVVSSTTLTPITSSFVTRSSGTAVLQMGVITPNTDATIDFGASNIATTSTTNTAFGILGTWATVNGADFAVNSTNLANGLIATPTYTDVTRLTGVTQTIADGSTTNVRIIEGIGSAANITLGAATTNIGTLTQSASGGTSAAVIDPAGQTLATNGILTATGAGSLTIGNGTNNGSLKAFTAGGDLTVSAQGSSTATINSVITDNGTSTLTKYGTGTLILTGNNTYAGVTKLNAGTLQLNGSSSTTGATVVNGGTLQLGHAGGLGSGTLTITGGSLDSSVTNLVNANNNVQNWNGDFSFVGTQNLDLGTGAVTLGANRNVTVNAGILKVGGVIGGAFALTKAGAGTLELAGANTFSGALTAREGTLRLSGAHTGASGTISTSDTAGTSATLIITNGSYSIATQMNVGNAPTIPATGTVNMSGGALIFTASNQLLIGQNTVGNTGIFNLSGGSITTTTSTSRGVMIGVNASAIGVFNLSGTGVLNMTAASGGGGDATLLVGRYDSAGADNTNATFNQTGGTANVGLLSIGGNGATGIGIISTLNLTGGTFAANQFPRLAAGNTNTSVINIGGTADVTLPAFPTTRGTSSTATINFNGGTLKPLVASATYMGGLTNAFIKSGGANINTTNGSITIAQSLLTDPMSTGGGLTKAGTNTLTLDGVNTYTGSTNVNGGTLALSATGSINNSSGVVLAGGTFDVAAKVGGYAVSNLSGNGAVIGTLIVNNQLAIGASPGTVNFASLTLAASSTYSYELTGGALTADLGNVSGSLAIDPNATLDLVQLGTYTPGDKFTLFGYQSGSLTGTFNSLPDDTTFTDAGGIWQIDYNDPTAGLNGGTGNSFVTVTAIPEPSTLVLGGLALLGFAGVGFRRRRMAKAAV